MLSHHRSTDHCPTDHGSSDVRPGPGADAGSGRDVPRWGRPAARRGAAALVILGLAIAAAGCGSSSDTPTSSGESRPKVVDVTFDGDSVTPNGERVDVAVGQKIELHVTADKPGEIHVHSDPEQELAYDKGTSTVDITPIDQPGIVEVESHALDKVILQLEVR